MMASLADQWTPIGRRKSEPMTHEFKKVREAAERALREIRADDHLGYGAVDWDAVSVRRVFWCEAESGETSYQVRIGPAAERSDLADRISEAISNSVPEPIEVLTGW